MSVPAEATATAPRLLQMVSLFQRSPSWTAAALATELGVTGRTVRRDVGRLRALGYPVETSFGPGGGYSMAAGVALPPMLLGTDEAVAVLLSLQEAAAGTSCSTDAALSALEKLRRVMPARLRTDLEALTRHTSDLHLGRMIGREPQFVDVAVLVFLARACRHRRRVHERSEGADRRSGRTLEPLHIVRTMGHWYLVAYLLDEGAWRTLRVDRLGQLTMSHDPCTHRPPDADATDVVAAHVREHIQKATGTIRVHAPAAAVAPWVESAWGHITEESSNTTIVHAGADTYAAMARWLCLIDADITVVEPDELRQAFHDLAQRIARAAH